MSSQFILKKENNRLGEIWNEEFKYPLLFSYSPEYSLFVGDLTEEVDDYTLYQAFSRRFKSCRSAKGKIIVGSVL